MKERERLLSIPEFSEALGLTVACTRRWILLRKVAHIKVGRLVRIPESQLDLILKEGYRPARTDRG